MYLSSQEVDTILFIRIRYLIKNTSETYDLLGMNCHILLATQNIVTIRRHNDLAKHNTTLIVCALSN
jgi:hypothetical protein